MDREKGRSGIDKQKKKPIAMKRKMLSRNCEWRWKTAMEAEMAKEIARKMKREMESANVKKKW